MTLREELIAIAMKQFDFDRDDAAEFVDRVADRLGSGEDDYPTGLCDDEEGVG